MGSLLGDSVGFLELFGSVAWPRGFSVDFPRKNPEETILPCGTPVRRPGAATRCRTRWGLWAPARPQPTVTRKRMEWKDHETQTRMDHL